MLNLVLDDCKRAMRRLVRQGVTVHSVVCDPPYGLTSIVKRFGNGQAAARTEGTDGSFSRLSGGFMNQQWDGTAIERDVEVWRLAYDLLLPGGYLLAFSSPRTGHRMACAIEDAGFTMHPFIGWTYGSGFPKAHAADKAIDKALGRKGQTVDGKYIQGTDEAVDWEGWAYGTQARKPALEPIYVAQKPFSESSGARNILKYGVGAVNIDGCRVPTDEIITNHSRGAESAVSKGKYGDSKAQETHQTSGQTKGRYPANLIHDGSSEVIEQFGRYVSDSPARFFESYPRDSDCDIKDLLISEARSCQCHNCCDEGEAVAGTGWHVRLSPFENKKIFYEAKAGKLDRAGSDHPTVKPVNLMRSLVRHVTPPGGTVLDPFAGTGTTGAAALAEERSAILIEQEPRFFMDMRRRFGIEFPTEGEALLRSLGFSV